MFAYGSTICLKTICSLCLQLINATTYFLFQFKLCYCEGPPLHVLFLPLALFLELSIGSTSSWLQLELRYCEEPTLFWPLPLPFTLSLGSSTGSTSSWMQLELHCCEGPALPWRLLLPLIIFFELILEPSTSKASNNRTCDGCRKMKRMCNLLTWWWDVLKRLCNFDWHNGEVHCRWLRDAWFCWCYRWSW